MKCYLIKETLTECTIDDIKKGEFQYCAIVTPDEYRSTADIFHMGIDIETIPSGSAEAQSEFIADRCRISKIN